MISICFVLFLLISILTSSYGQVTCASGWVKNGGSCYMILPAFNSGTIDGTWDQCYAHCASYPGATMLCVNNAAENEWIDSQNGNGWIWIGYTDMPPYGRGKGTRQYGWVTGCSSTYTNWKAGQPDNASNNQDYTAVNLSDGSWNDRSPQSQLYCGCEYTPALITTPSSRPTTAPSSYPSTVSPFGSSASPSSCPTVAPSSEPTSSPTTTTEVGDVSE